jgi:hypothetical protein
MDWTVVIQERIRWKAIVNAVKLRVPYNIKKFLSNCVAGKKGSVPWS